MPRNSRQNELISIVVPVLNEEANVEILSRSIQENLSTELYEIIFVDDGSTDRTLEVLQNISAENSHIHYVSLSRNWGHQQALKAGFDYASGDCVITMDGDSQHPPELIPELLKRWRAGADVVHTIRRKEEGQALFKEKTSSLFYRVMNLISSVNLVPNTADFRLLDRKIVEICSNLNEDVLFWRGIIPWLGFSQEYLEYSPNKRLHGESKYNLIRMLRLAWNGISSFSLFPLRIASALGGILLCCALIYQVYIMVQFFLGNALPGWASILTVIIGLGAIQLIILGIIGEYLGKIYIGIKKRPFYLVGQVDEGLQGQRKRPIVEK